MEMSHIGHATPLGETRAMSRLAQSSFCFALLGLVTACGSTVSLSGQAATGAGTNTSALSGATSTDSGSTGATSGTTTTGAQTSTNVTNPDGTTTSTIPSSTAGTNTTGPATNGGSPVSATIPATGKGWDQKYVYIGVVTQKDAQAAFAQFGAKNVDPGDSEAQANAVVSYLNSKGGLFGRQVKIKFRDVATVSTATNADSTGAAVCTYFSQDNPVVAVLSIVTVMDYPSFRSCLARAKIPLFSATVKTVDDQASAQLSPYFYQTIAVSWNSLAPALVSRLSAQGWFGGWNTALGKPASTKAKVGILIDGTDTGTRVGQIVKKALAKAGYPDSLIYQYGDASQGQQSSVFYFKGNGVTHVIVTDVELTAFQTSANNQQYKPRYGITSYNDPYSNLEASGLTPAGANDGAMGVGYAPGLDVSDSNAPAPSAGSKTCIDLMKKAGQTFPNKRLAFAIAMSMCDGIMLTVKGAIAGGGLDGSSIYQGIQKLGPTYSPATGFRAALSSTKRFVPGQARDLAYYPACKCFKYRKGSVAL